MRAARLFLSLAISAVCAGAEVQAENTSSVTAGSSAFVLPGSGLVFVTGDTWLHGNQKFRLYGVQSCIRGSFYTNKVGHKSDCGEVSLAVLAAMIKDTRPICSAVAQVSHPLPTVQPTILVVCSAHIGNAVVDLGTAIIAQGFSFAAINNEGRPVYPPYAVAEMTARQREKGLWSFSDFPHPYRSIN